MSLQLAVSSTFKKVPSRGVIERNCWIKALNLASVIPKPASAQASKPPSIGMGEPFLGLYTNGTKKTYKLCCISITSINALIAVGAWLRSLFFVEAVKWKR
ncbi:hypothetical protein H6G97_51730 [Nostoc flagelliforme FACHB-838]|uniref:Transposase n=1 Tax=Nostoc flagelliforme FACHB-838 TaxID=2692904 RepID=A0ABR8E6X2_9NOSO|nr:hypothetical protein [Nostoc flagelliforme]MBD2537203.1 hypothetical protein [Nostoc flagelliforme FACHB-838]